MKNVSAAVKIHYRQIAFLIFVKNCGWQDDAVQNDNPDYKGGANQMSLNEAKEAYKKGEKVL